jgi:hypothetical protein
MTAPNARGGAWSADPADLELVPDDMRSCLRAGRIWLAWAITGLRALVRVPNFFAYPSATFGETTTVAPFSLLGEPVSVPVGQLCQGEGASRVAAGSPSTCSAGRSGRRITRSP